MVFYNQFKGHVWYSEGKKVMRKQTSSMDGFVPRRGPAIGGGSSQRLGRPVAEVRPQIGRASRPINTSMTPRPIAVSRREIDDSLAQIEDDEIPKPSRPRLFGKRQKPPLTARKRFAKRLATFFVVLLLAGGAFIAIKAMIASGNVFQGNIFDIFQSKPLQMDENGRSNVLVFGTSEDDPGHQGGSLTDSIMVVSIDQNKKNAYMISIPRDMQVEYGDSCQAGNAGKINALYQCFYDNGDDEDAGAKALQKKVSEITGLDVQYYAHVNYTVVRDTVKALGSIDVKIESADPRGIMDSNFDWKCRGGKSYASHATMVKNCPPDGHFIQYPNGVVTLDAEHALYLAQARGDAAPTYGLERSNFDREINQQKIVKAIKEKAASAGTLTNIGAVTGLIDAFGKNLRTDFETSEIRTLMQLGNDIPSKNIQSISLIKEGEEVVTNGYGGNIVPTAGTYEYGEIQSYINKNISSDPVSREAANIVVMNGTAIAGIALTESGRLTEAGFTVSNAINAPTNDYKKTTIYRITSEGTDGTAAALAKRYDVKLITTPPKFTVAEGVDFVVIVGQDSINTAE
jgi:LCP family protein required for cell wall assembly